MSGVGVLGGSFDPVHRGHLELASRARQVLGLSHVILLPCSVPPHKPDRALAARYHRLEMLYLAVEDRVGLEVSTLEIAHDGICYTIDTLRALRDATPSCAPLFLCGSDALADIPSWREHEALLAEFDFAAVIRPDETGAPRDPGWPEVVSRRLTPLAKAGSGSLGAGGHVYPLDLPALPISSSLVRARCRQHQPMADVVPALVARYIQRHRLYLEEAAR